MNIIVLISGNGSNLQAIIDADIDVTAVISNESDAFGLERARKANIPAHIVDHRDFANRDAFDKALQQQIDVYKPDLIVLAGFMRRLGEDFVNHYENKMINIHPSLLPKYPGLHTHRKVLENNDREHGVSIHIVTADLDAGPLLAQEKLIVNSDDTEASLKNRIQLIEHQLYPAIIKKIIQKKLL